MNLNKLMGVFWIQVGASTPRIANNVKQIVQVRAPQQPKETNKTPTTAVANSVAPNLAKTLPAKANVIVLHKNSPLVKNMQQQQTAATKVNLTSIHLFVSFDFNISQLFKLRREIF